MIRCVIEHLYGHWIKLVLSPCYVLIILGLPACNILIATVTSVVACYWSVFNVESSYWLTLAAASDPFEVY